MEEMFSIDVPSGAVYYGEIRKRENIEITAELREQVRKMLTEMHELFQRGYTPRVKWSKACNACSLKDICLPKLGKAGSVSHYIDTHIREETL